MLLTLQAHCIEQLINLEKVRTDNLKFRTDLRDLVMDGWSVTQWMNVYKGRLLKKSSNWILKLAWLPVNAGHYMAFKHHISFTTDLAANCDCDWFRITPDIVSKLLHAGIWSCCTVQFESEQTPFSQTGRWFRPAALYRFLLGTCCFVPMS